MVKITSRQWIIAGLLALPLTFSQADSGDSLRTSKQLSHLYKSDSIKPDNNEKLPEDSPFRSLILKAQLPLLLEDRAYAETGIQFIPLSHVKFETDKSALIATSKRTLNASYEYLKDLDGIQRIILQGHADKHSSQSYNQTLSESRVKTVKDYFIAQGIPEDMIQVQGQSKNTPIDENWTVNGRSRNRRVEVYLVRSL